MQKLRDYFPTGGWGVSSIPKLLLPKNNPQITLKFPYFHQKGKGGQIWDKFPINPIIIFTAPPGRLEHCGANRIVLTIENFP